MLKRIALSLFFLIYFLPSYGQKTTLAPIQTVKQIFYDYVEFAEGTDSEDDKTAMTSSLIALQKSAVKKDLPLLIDVWMYYDPTDFPTQEFINPIFNKNKATALEAIDKRLKHKRKGEDKTTAPYADLIALRKRLSK